LAKPDYIEELERKDDPDRSEKDKEIFLSNLKKEYLKMNRLTQKLVFYLINLEPDDQKFGKFLVGIFFGDSIKKHYEKNGIIDCKLETKFSFQEMVNAHLKAANQLIKKEEQLQIPSQSVKENLSRPANQRLGAVLFPPERAQKFDQMFRTRNLDSRSSSKKKSKSSLHFTENTLRQKNNSTVMGQFEPVQVNESYINPLSSQNELMPYGQNLENPCERPTICEDDIFARNRDYIDFGCLPHSYFHHWDYLRQKVVHYQNRLMHFYDLLNNLAYERIKENKIIEEERRRYDMRGRRYDPGYDLRPMEHNLRKRGDLEFELRKEMEERERRGPGDRYHR
jgi:hypothetical protein